MARRKITEEDLMKKVLSYLPKELKGKDVISDVEIDPYGNSERSDGISYWVYLKNGYITEGGYGCHTIHEDSLKEIKYQVKNIVEVDYEDHDGYGY